MPQQSLYEEYLAKKRQSQQPTAPPPPTRSLYEEYKAKTKTPNSAPQSPTAPPGKSHGWLADTAWNFGKQAWDRIYETGENLLNSSEANQFAAFTRKTAAEHAADTEAAKKSFNTIPSPYEAVKGGLGAITPMGALRAPFDIGEQVVEDVSQGNWGGLAGSAAIVGGGAYLGLRGAGKGNKLASSLAPESPYNVPHPPSPYNVPRPDYSVPRPKSPYDVPMPPAPYDVPSPPPGLFDVERPLGPSSPFPQRKLPERAGMGTQDLYPRGPRTPPLLGLGQGTPYQGNQFFGGEGGRPVTDIFDPSNIDIYGEQIDPSITAQNTVRNPPVQPGYNPALQRPGTSMPLEKPLVYAPPPVEPVVAPTPAKAGKVGRRPKNAITPDVVSPEVLAAGEALPEGTKPVTGGRVAKPKAEQPVKPPKPVPISKLTDDELVERVKLGTATPEIQAEIVKRITKKEKAQALAAKEAARVAEPVVEQPTGPPKVEPPKVEPPVATLPKVEPVPVPDLTPAPDVEPPKGRPSLTAAEETSLKAAVAQAKLKYGLAKTEAAHRQTPAARLKETTAMKEFAQALRNLKEGKLPGAVTKQLPKVEPIPDVKVPDVEPPKLDLSGKTRDELIEVARTADDATATAIRGELAARRKAAAAKAGTDLPSGFGSLQDAPRILKQEFDDWRVLKNLPENQAAFEEFLRDTGRAAAVTFKRSGRFEEHYKKGEQELRETNNVRDLKGLRGFWEGQKGMYVHVDNAEATSWASQLIADIDTKIKSLEKFESETPKKSIVPDVDQSVLKEERRADYKESIRIKAETDVDKAKANWFYWEDEILKHLKSGNKDELILARQMAREAADHLDDIRGIKRHVPEPLSPVVTSKLEEDLPPVWDRIHELELEDLTNKAGTKEGLTWEELQRARELTKRKPNLGRMDTHYKDDTPIKGETPMEEMKRLAKKGMTPEGETRLEVERFRKLRNEYAEQHGIDPFDEAFEQLDTDPSEFRLKAHKTAYDTKPVPKVESELPEIEPVLPPLESLSTKELMEFARSAVGRLEEDAVRAEVARRRNRRKGETIHSTFSALTDAGPILKAEFDQWRVLKELPENQEAFDKFLADTGRFVSPASRAAAGQKWDAPAKDVKIGAGAGNIVNMPLEGMAQFERDRAAIGSSTPRGRGRTISDVDLGEESRFGKRGTGRELPEAKPPVSREAVRQGTVGREELQGLSNREVAKISGREAALIAREEAMKAAEARGRQAAIDERQRAKTTAKVVRREDRLRVRTKKLEEKKAIVAAKKATKKAAEKAAEVKPAEVAEVRPTLINKMRNSKFMAANPQLKTITDKLIKRRSAGNLIGKGIRDKFKDIVNIPKSQIVEFQKALGRGEYPEVRKFFDDLHDDLTARGIEMGEKENYLPQIWEGKTKDLRAAFGDKRMTEKASFQFRSFLDDYEAGIAKNLKPAKSPIELIEWYGQRANKLIADNAALKELKAAGYLNKKRLVGMDEMDPNLGTFKGHYAEPKVKYIIENYLKSAESESGFGHAIRKGAGKITSTMLSAGIPKVPLATFHGIGMSVRAGLEGGPRRLLKAVEYGLNSRKAARVLEAENAAMVKATQDHGFSTKVEHVGEKGKLFEDPDIGRTKKAFNWLSEKQHNAFEKNLFERMIPALKWDAWKANYAKLIKKGLSEAEAGAKATQITDSFYSGKNVDLLYNDKNFNTFVEAVTLAPNWLRSTLDLGGKVPKSYVQLLKNPKNPVAQKYAGAGVRMATVYAGANLLQKALTGKFMVENEPQDIFNLHLGETKEGQPRSLKLFGTAGDFARIPAQIISATMKNMGGGEALAGATEARLSPIITMALGMRDGEDYQGNVNFFGTRDTYGNETSKGKRIGNTVLQGLGYGPPQLSAPINYAAGRAGLEETIAKLVEAPIKYGRKKKSKPFSLELPMPAGSTMQFPRTR